MVSSCLKCGKHCKNRSEFLLHISICGKRSPTSQPTSKNNIYSVLPDESNEEESDDDYMDDSDADPNWLPEDHELSEKCLGQYLPLSSPVTGEQMDTALHVEPLLIEVFDKEQDKEFRKKPMISGKIEKINEQINQWKEGRRLTNLQGKKSLGRRISRNIKNLTDLSKGFETEKSGSNEDLMEQDKESRIKPIIRDKIQIINEQINQWKEKRRLANLQGKKSLGRRISRNIKKLTDLSKGFEAEKSGSNEDLMAQECSTYSNEVTSTSTKFNTVLKNPPCRKENFCFYCQTKVLRFCEHIEKRHPNEPVSILLKQVTGTTKQKRQQKMNITLPLRKKWNAEYNKTHSIDLAIPVKKRHGGKPVGSVVCRHCSGSYRRDKLSVHLRHCTEYLMSEENDSVQNSVQAIKSHSYPQISDKILKCISKEFVNEILQGINVDNVMLQALSDPLIMKFASEFHKSRREPSNKPYVIREIRDITKLLMKMKEFDQSILKLEDCFNPKNFDLLVNAALHLANYREDIGEVGVPSVAYRLSQPLKDAAKLFKSDALAEIYNDQTSDRAKVIMIDDFLGIINNDWKTKIGRICVKTRKTARVVREEVMAVEKDIVKLASYIEGTYREIVMDLELSGNKSSSYDLLTHMLVTHIMLLVRRRPIDFKNAKIQHYHNVDKHDELVSMGGGNDMTVEDLNICKKFHLFYVPGKNLEIVPMVLTPRMKSVMDILINNRRAVNISSDTLFTLSNGKQIMPNQSMNLMKKRVKLIKPSHLTGNGLRHQAATFSKLHSTHPQYQDYLASLLGHTLSVHKKHYELPSGVLQKLMVCPILNNIMTGQMSVGTTKPNSTGPKNTETEAIPLPGPQNAEYIISTNNVQEGVKITHQFNTAHTTQQELNLTTENYTSEEENLPGKKKRWTEEEQHVVFSYFGKQILSKQLPKRNQVVDFYSKYKQELFNRSIDQVYLFIRNHVLRQQLNVTPKVKKCLQKKRV